MMAQLPRALIPRSLTRAHLLMAHLLLVGLVLLMPPLLMPRLIAPAAAADDELIHETLREFYRSGKYVLYIDGQADTKSRIYHSRRAGAFLVLGSSYGKPLLVQPRETTISALSEDQVAERPDKGVDVLAEAKVTKLGAIRLDKGGMAIKVEGLLARLQPQPYLLGAKDAATVLLHSPEYQRAGAAYRPRAADVKRIKAGTKEIEVVVFFGSWCPSCRRLLPRILRVDEAIAGSKIKVTYYGLPKGKAMRRDPEARKRGIKRIPTGIVLVDGRAVGTISSRGWSRPEKALAALAR
jgi:thiol-disulfide isomerase/thioredoxin